MRTPVPFSVQMTSQGGGRRSCRRGPFVKKRLPPMVEKALSEESDTSTFDPIPQLVAELQLPASGIGQVIQLMAGGATVPFIARYRKEATGGLDEVQIRAIAERAEYLTELEARRASVIAEIQKQGKLTPELAAKLRGRAPRRSSRICTCRSNRSAARAP